MQRVFDSFTVILNFITGHQLQWALNPGFTCSFPVNFTVQVASTMDFSEIIYTIDAGDNFYCIDDSNIKQSWSRDILYRVKLTTGTGNNEKCYYSEILSFDSAPSTKRKYRMAAEISRKNTVWFKFAGYQGYLLKRKSFGQIDTANVDPISLSPITDNVGGFGTGIVGGFYNPISVAFVVEQSEKDKSLSPDGMSVKELGQMVIRTTGFPYIEKKDIIVKAETNQRYIVEGFKYVFFPGTEICLQQKLTLMLLPMSDNSYKIPCPAYQVPKVPLALQPNP